MHPLDNAHAEHTIKSSQVCGPQPCELCFLLIFVSIIKQKRETVKTNSSYVQQLAWNVMAETEKEVNEDTVAPVYPPLADGSVLNEKDKTRR